MVLTNGVRAEHFLECNREFMIAPVHLQVDLTEVRCTIHANLHKGGNGGRLLTLLFLALVRLDGHDVLPERSNGWPTHHLCPNNIKKKKRKCYCLYKFESTKRSLI